MKYYSEILKKLYDSKDELIKAEVEATKAKTDRATKAKEVTELIKKANEATKIANKALTDFVKEYATSHVPQSQVDFVKEYGSFKTTIKDEDVDVKSDFFDLFYKFMF